MKMSVVVLWTALASGVAVFAALFVSVWRHHARAMTSVRRVAVECVWQAIPCLIVALAAAPSVYRVL